MTTLLERLPANTKDALRRHAAAAETMVLPHDDHRPAGAYAANMAYHARQRALGAAEMQALLDAAGLRTPLTVDEMQAVLLSAIDLFLRTDDIDAEATVQEGTVAVTVTRCPIFDHFMDADWHGITACGCFSRRQGWYDALRAPVSEQLLLNRKWDDPVCRTELRLQVEG